MPDLLAALHGERQTPPPVWFMRQAGRSLPEYQQVRLGVDMLDACLTPALAAEITLQPVRRHRVDAAILFSDIVVPLRLAGVDVQIVPGRGPVFPDPVRSHEQLDRLLAIDPAGFDTGPVEEAVRLVVAELGDTPLIGFAGAPFTLAAYLVEGGPSKEHLRARGMMHADPDAWTRLADWLARLSATFLAAQVRAGASAVQLFDSWGGSLGRADYARHAAPHSRTALVGIEVPRIHFGLGIRPDDLAIDGVVEAVGVDWRTPLDEAAALAPAVTLQGNVDPALLDAPWPVLVRHVDDVLRRGEAARAHIVNLGHGVPPSTDPDVLTRLVAHIHGDA